MRVSIEWIREWLNLSVSPEQVSQALTLQGIEVESIVHTGFSNVVVGQILQVHPHPQADRLSICHVNDGAQVWEVICGASNFKLYDKVALARIGSCLPNGIKIKPTKMRGVISSGMLCAAQELGLSFHTDGLLILDAHWECGQDVAKLFYQNDILFDLKITPNRADCLGHIGIAREVSSIVESPLHLPESYYHLNHLIEKKSPSVFTKMNDCVAFSLAFIEGVVVQDSPQWIKARLEHLECSSINNVVDATNFILWESGHPVHVYDAKTIIGNIRVGTLKELGFGVRQEFIALDRTTLLLLEDDLVVADQQKVIALAGIIGSLETSVQSTTQQILLECGVFNPKSVRRTAKRLAKVTLASQRFEKGLDGNGVPGTLNRLVEIVHLLAGGKLTQVMYDVPPAVPRLIEVRLKDLWSFIGFSDNFLSKKIQKKLEYLGFNIDTSTPDIWFVTAPTYRADVSIWQDIADEAVRCVGFDHIHSVLPVMQTMPVFKEDNQLEQVKNFKNILCANGFYEAINFGFTSEKWLQLFGLNSFIKLLNPLSEQTECLVPSLIPGLMRNYLENFSHEHSSESFNLRLFEIRKVFFAEQLVRAESLLQTNVKEHMYCAGIMSGLQMDCSLRTQQKKIDFFDLKGVLENVFHACRLTGVYFKPADNTISSFLHTGRSAWICFEDKTLGVCGVLHPRLQKHFKINSDVFLFEFDLEKFHNTTIYQSNSFKAWSNYPAITRDFAILAPRSVLCDKIQEVALKAGKPLAKSVEVFDIYEAPKIGETYLSVAIRVKFYEMNRSLQEQEVAIASEKICNALENQLGLQMRTF